MKPVVIHFLWKKTVPERQSRRTIRWIRYRWWLSSLRLVRKSIRCGGFQLQTTLVLSFTTDDLWVVCQSTSFPTLSHDRFHYLETLCGNMWHFMSQFRIIWWNDAFIKFFPYWVWEIIDQKLIIWYALICNQFFCVNFSPCSFLFVLFSQFSAWLITTIFCFEPDYYF
jgi:hypothetical protein